MDSPFETSDATDFLRVCSRPSVRYYLNMIEKNEPEIYDELRSVVDIEEMSERAQLAYRIICKINRDWNR